MIAREPGDLPALFARYAAAGDLRSLLDLYEPEAAFVGPDGTPAIGADAVRERLDGLLSASPRIVSSPCRVVVAGDVALICSAWKMSFAGHAGPGIESQSTEVARRQADGSWRYVIDDPASATGSQGAST